METSREREYYLYSVFSCQCKGVEFNKHSYHVDLGLSFNFFKEEYDQSSLIYLLTQKEQYDHYNNFSSISNCFCCTKPASLIRKHIGSLLHHMSFLSIERDLVLEGNDIDDNNLYLHDTFSFSK